jgi:small subunit ribosomal protein S6e
LGQKNNRIKSLLSGGVGFKPKRKGQRRRKTVRGNTISDDIVQINTIVVKKGAKSIEDLLQSDDE